MHILTIAYVFQKFILYSIFNLLELPAPKLSRDRWEKKYFILQIELKFCRFCISNEDTVGECATENLT